LNYNAFVDDEPVMCPTEFTNNKNVRAEVVVTEQENLVNN